MSIFLKYPIILFFTLALQACDKKENPVEIEKPDPLSEQELLDKVQLDAFRYFWDYAEPNSKLARERYHISEPSFDMNVVTTGGSGFGLMNILVGIERGFITRSQAISNLQTSLRFLRDANRFHGAWSHWMDGTNGNVIPFGTVDNGGDIVETAFLCQGLICVREYFKNGTAEEQELANLADTLWKGVEWNWYTKGENALYWHWSPQYEWQMNFRIEGYNECLIAYILGVSSPTFAIPVEAYHQTWARSGGIVSDRLNYGLPIVLNYNGTYGVGPLFWSHYSYLGLDPRGLSDQYANYWTLTCNHAKIMHNYAIANPLGWTGYNDSCWGLTASYTRNYDGSVGYTAHHPGNDRGVISPTAALSSYPYTPEESLKFLRYVYETHPEKYVGIMGPFDAFSPHHNWVTRRYLAIDQGPIAPMIENHRTGLLWNLFMGAPEVRQGLILLGFQSSQHGI